MSSKNVGKPLTADLVFTKTKSSSLQNIKNLNLWGNDLQDLSLIDKMPNLEVISLSVNRISSLKYFSNCQKLQELYLRKNNVEDIRQIRYLANLPTLKVLWLHDNPCAQIQNYRSIVIKNLPNLMKLDNNPVTLEEKTAAQNTNFSIEVKSEPKNQSNYRSQKQVGYAEQKKPRSSANSSNYHQAPSRQPQPSSQYPPYKEEDNQYKQKIYKKTGLQGNKKIYDAPRQEDITRNQNILMAVLSLMRQLDSGSLQIVRRQAQKLLK